MVDPTATCLSGLPCGRGHGTQPAVSPSECTMVDIFTARGGNRVCILTLFSNPLFHLVLTLEQLGVGAEWASLGWGVAAGCQGSLTGASGWTWALVTPCFRINGLWMPFWQPHILLLNNVTSPPLGWNWGTVT